MCSICLTLSPLLSINSGGTFFIDNLLDSPVSTALGRGLDVVCHLYLPTGRCEFYCSLSLIIVKLLATVSRSTKRGLSVWHFVDADGCFYAFGGVDPSCKVFAKIEDLRKCYKSWTRYGYKPGVPTPTKQVSTLPADLQEDLWALPNTCA